VSKPSASVVRRVAALGFTPAKIARYVAAMQKTPSGRSAGATREGEITTRYAGIDFSPPSAVRDAAVEALEWRFRDGHKGGTDIGVGRALQLAVEDVVPPRDIDRMVNYGTRHAVDLRSKGARRGEITPGVVAWGLWGGADGIAWAREVQAAMRDRDAGARRRRNPPKKSAKPRGYRAPIYGPAILAGYPTEASIFPPGWDEAVSLNLTTLLGAGERAVTDTAMEPGQPVRWLVDHGLARVIAQHRASDLLYAGNTIYDVEPTPKGRDLAALRDQWRTFHGAKQRSLLGNPAPGYRSWAWTTQDWRVVVPRRDGSVDYSAACGAPSNRTRTGHVHLCLPLAVARALDADAEGRRILHAQATRKARAKPGARVAWHPTIRELWRALEARTPADNARYRSRK
jgi:hypothetical protein